MFWPSRALTVQIVVFWVVKSCGLDTSVLKERAVCPARMVVSTYTEHDSWDQNLISLWLLRCCQHLTVRGWLVSSELEWNIRSQIRILTRRLFGGNEENNDKLQSRKLVSRLITEHLLRRKVKHYRSAISMFSSFAISGNACLKEGGRPGGRPLTSIYCRIASTYRKAERQVRLNLGIACYYTSLVIPNSGERDSVKAIVITENQGAGNSGVISTQFGNEWFQVWYIRYYCCCWIMRVIWSNDGEVLDEIKTKCLVTFYRYT
jgi:hypothetical protein